MNEKGGRISRNIQIFLCYFCWRYFSFVIHLCLTIDWIQIKETPIKIQLNSRQRDPEIKKLFKIWTTELSKIGSCIFIQWSLRGKSHIFFLFIIIPRIVSPWEKHVMFSWFGQKPNEAGMKSWKKKKKWN